MWVPPEGVFPFYMSNTSAEKQGLKSGPGILDLVFRKSFSTSSILDEIKTYGFMSAFHPCEQQLKKCDLEEVVVVCDPASQWGEMFLLLHTESSIRSFMPEQELEAIALTEEITNEADADGETSDLEPNVVTAIDPPIIAKAYHSSTMNETSEYVRNLSLCQQTPLLSCLMTRPIHPRKRTVNFGDRNYDVSGGVDFFPQVIPEFDISFSEKEIGVQAAPTTASSATQTTRRRKINKIVQYEPLELGDLGLSAESIGASMLTFLKRVLPSVESALQENETVDIFADALNVAVPDDRFQLDSDRNEQLKELRNFIDLRYSKGKTLTCIAWHPTKSRVLATSTCEPLRCDERIKCSGETTTSHVVIWRFDNQIHPLNVLQSPLDCPKFWFNPTQPNVIVGGCISGQVIMWHLSDFSLDYQDAPSITPSGMKNLPLQPFAMSHPEHSHRRMVADLAWLPANIQINAKGQLLSSDHMTNVSNQFITISGDGQVLFWDVRFEDINAGKLSHVAKPKPPRLSSNRAQMYHKNKKEKNVVETNWAPFFKIKVKRLEGAGEVSLCQLVTRSVDFDHYELVQNKPRGELLCSSEEGDLVSVDWLSNCSTDSDRDTKDNSDAAMASVECVKWMKSDHHRFCNALIQSPFFPEYVASVSDWSFHLWKTDPEPNCPVFSSPNATTRLTGGRWSPSRPGVLFLSKVDGTLDVWDFSETSYSRCNTLILIPNSITSMEFLSGDASSQQQQLLAVGDSVGSLHIFEVPRRLSVSQKKEKEAIARIFELERKRNDPIKMQEVKMIPSPYTEGELRLDSSSSGNSLPSPATEDAFMDEEDTAYLELESKLMEEVALLESSPDMLAA